jgi:hypothetical protein
VTTRSFGWETAKAEDDRLVALGGEVRAQLKARAGRRSLVRVYVQTSEGWAGVDIDVTSGLPGVVATATGRTKRARREALEGTAASS